MEKYIGTKTIMAEPMTLGDAFGKQLVRRTVVDKDNFDDPGYHVVYEDGYESWSPAETFEKAYKLAETPLDRIKIEDRDLQDKVDKLSAFLGSEKSKNLDEESLALLISQHSIMHNYLAILHRRENKFVYRCGPIDMLPFSIAIEALKSGYSIRRKSWGNGVILIKQVPCTVPSDVIPKMQSLPESAKKIIKKQSRNGQISYRDQCLIYHLYTEYADSWNPSVSDIFANDWEVVL